MTSLHGSPVAIVLAAGESRRLGRDKPFALVDGTPLVERVVEAFLGAAKVHEVVLVVGPGRHGDFSWLEGRHVHVVENPRPEAGMITSIRVGLDTTWAQGRDVLITPGDIPYLRSEHVDRVVSEFMARPACRILLPAYRGLGGHPGMYAADLREAFYLHGSKQGAREVIVRHADATVRVNLHDPDICFDVDTPEDLRLAPDAGARWARVEQKVEAKRARQRG